MIAGALGAAAVSAGAACIYGVVDPNSSMYGPVVSNGPRDRTVYLTFDDGPSRQWTPRVLDILSRFGISATFFVVGRFCQEQRAIVREAAADGHVIGNHTWSHRKLHLRSRSWIANELDTTHDVISSITGTEPRSFRAPHGYRNPFVGSVTKAMNYTTFGWSYGVWDTAMPGVDAIRRRMHRKMRPGAVLLLHDGDGYDADGDRSQTVDALPGIIQDTLDLGYTFRTIEPLLLS